MRRNVAYQPPFPYFGGKSAVAETVWRALGDVDNYVEPFFGSGAVLFLRPQIGRIETVNDADGFVANFWRALQREPDAVAEHADNPVNEADLHARHLWLLQRRESLTDRLSGDPEFCDAKAAGWWAWGLCCWIGSGWCSGKGPWIAENGVLTLRNSERPHLGNSGQGVNRQRPHLGNSGQGVNRQLNRQLPHLRNSGKGVDEATAAPGRLREGRQQGTARGSWLREYLGDFAERLRHVRVCCGDWSRVCGPSVTFRHGLTGVFLDPPYADTATRTSDLYAVDCEQVAHQVREWAIEQGKNPLMRIVLAGYAGEHDMPPDWRVHEWKAVGGYGLISDDEQETGRANRGRERLWLSPACLVMQKQATMFDGANP